MIAEAISRVTQAAELISPSEEPRAWLIAQRDLGDMMRQHGRWSETATINHYRQALESPATAEAPDIRGELNYWLAIQIYPGTRAATLEQYREAADIITMAVADTPRGGSAESFFFFSANFMASMMKREYALRLHPAGATEAAEAVRYAEAAADVFTDPDSASWAIGQSLLAEALAVQARAENSTELYDRSATVMRNVQARRPRGRDDTSWASRQKLLADNLSATDPDSVHVSMD
ncbi:hypothetical protein [Brevundimonas lutea]|uniref:hypothetical protein n=1 Tax=Brevundimonas lutea TaxID=2293980 RepID=UPI0013CF1054|nr:hypothetical protein [Brevundimonas lutea]